MTGYQRFKTITAGAAMLVGAVMLTLPGRPGPLVPWLVTGFCALVAAADLLEARTDRDDRDDEETDQ
jgi:hypothetical protein